jgi:beta-N-acetylhexosaminidase
MRAALITGLEGSALTEAEKAFLREARPCGLILFARNCLSPDQVRKLVDESKDAIASGDLLVLVDQEGGRVRRLRPPQWQDLPAAGAFAARYGQDAEDAMRAAWLAARRTAGELVSCGINTNCAPVLDLAVPGAHAIIGDRAYGASPEQVARLGRAVAEGYLAGGVLPVIKHIPGHGRALADSHFELPVVSASRDELSRTDFAPFRALSDMPAAMTAHVVYAAVDPDLPASISPRVVGDVIRGEIGFGGFLMSDDLSMEALKGPIRARAEAVIAAGSDAALHCNGCLAEMEAVAAGAPPLSGESLRRFERCLSILGQADPYSIAEADAALRRVLAASL